MPLDQSPVSRRTVAKGAAWGVPAVAVAAAAPTLAASPTVAHDLSTSVPGGATRISGTQLDLAPTNFINTGSETVEGLRVVFQVDSGQTIDDITTFGQQIEDLAVGATISGEGTNEVILTLAPGTGLGQVTIPAGESYQAPAGQSLTLSSATAFDLSVTVNAANMQAGDVPFSTTQTIAAA